MSDSSPPPPVVWGSYGEDGEGGQALPSSTSGWASLREGAWLALAGLSVLLGLYILLVGILGGRMSFALAGTIMSVPAAAVLTLWRRQLRQAAAIVAGALSLFVASSAFESRLLGWLYPIIAIWYLIDLNRRPGQAEQAAVSSSPTSKANPFVYRVWRFLTWTSIVVGLLGLILSVGLGLWLSGAETSSGWEGLGIFILGAVAIFSLLVTVVPGVLIMISSRRRTLAALLSMLISTPILVCSLWFLSDFALVIVIWAGMYLSSAVATLVDKINERQLIGL